MAAKKPKIEIQFKGDVSQLRSSFKQAGDITGSLGFKFGGLMKSVGKLGGAFAGLYAIKQVAGFMMDAAKAAAADEQQSVILHKAISNLTGATKIQLDALDQYIDKTQLATGFSEDLLRPAMVKLTTATKDVAEAQDLLSVAMDTATARGAELDTIVTALSKAAMGNVTSLQRMGIETKDASGKAKDFKTILEDLRDAYGGATAAAADTLAGKTKRLGIAWGEVKETIGAALMPTIEKFADWALKNMPKIEKAVKELGDAFATAAKIAYTAWRFVRGAIEEAKYSLTHAPGVPQEEWGPQAIDKDSLHFEVLKDYSLNLQVLDGRMIALRYSAQYAGTSLEKITDGFKDSAWSLDDARDSVNKFASTIQDASDRMVGLFDQVVKGEGEATKSLDQFMAEQQGQIDKIVAFQSEAAQLIRDWGAEVGMQLVEQALSMGPDYVHGLIGADPGTVREAFALLRQYTSSDANGLGNYLAVLMHGIGYKAARALADGWASVPASAFAPKTLPVYGPNARGWAGGGLITRPQMALVGEAGPEAIIPLTKPARAQEVMQQAGLTTEVNLEPLIAEVRALRTDVQRTNTRIIRALAVA